MNSKNTTDEKYNQLENEQKKIETFLDQWKDGLGVVEDGYDEIINKAKIYGEVTKDGVTNLSPEEILNKYCELINEGYCKDCNELLAEQSIPILTNTNAWKKEIKEATCSEDGYIKYKVNFKNSNPCEPGMYKNPMNNCQCVPMPNPQEEDEKWNN